jgi:hypothetical protein
MSLALVGSPLVEVLEEQSEKFGLRSTTYSEVGAYPARGLIKL